ncbi:MAG: dihydroorotase [Acidobacteriia bacterium]|nr:dihydroorotase [Terriglobia bacterium]
MSGLIIRNGRVICPATHRDEIAEVWIEGGIISRVVPGSGRVAPGSGSPPGPGDSTGYETVDASGLIVAPGFIDLHTHLREPGREDCETIESGGAAAAAGGFTSICAMPNTQPVNDGVSVTQFILQRARSHSPVRVFPIAAVTLASAGEVRTDFEELMAAGAVGFSDDGKAVKTDTLMRDALRDAKRLGTFVSDHCEDLSLTEGAVMNEGEVSRALEVPGLPPVAEDAVVERDIRIAQETAGHAHIAHLSTAGALDLVRWAKHRGTNITCEVAPHHFTLVEGDVRRYGANAKMKPPLRTPRDVEALVEGLADGTVDAIATDHAPHSAVEKGRGLSAAPFGITGLETAVSLAIQRLVQPAKLGWGRLVELFSANPARILQRHDLGRIEQGALADLTIIDPATEWTFRAAGSRSKSQNSPFDGWTFRGKVVMTVVGGKVVFDARACLPSGRM